MHFNVLMRELRRKYEGKERDRQVHVLLFTYYINSFWKMIVQAGITLIHSEEAADSCVTPVESAQVSAQHLVFFHFS